MPPEETQDPDVLEAIKWFVRLRDEEATDDDRRAFEAWLNESPAHLEAWERANKLWDRFSLAGVAQAQRRRRTVSRRIFLGGGAGVIVLATVAGYWVAHPELGADFHTGLGERRTVTLPDGSRVELGSGSALSVRFDETSRRTQLFSGEAYFIVSPDVRRPFVVEAEGGSVQALGTCFDVKIAENAVVVTVTEHAALVRFGVSPPARVEQGFQVNYDARGLGRIARADLDAVEAWRQDLLVFKELPLSQVLMELARYRRGRILLLDRRLGDIPVTGVFDTRQADAALRTIAEALPIRLVHVTDYVVFVYAR